MQHRRSSAPYNQIACRSYLLFLIVPPPLCVLYPDVLQCRSKPVERAAPPAPHLHKDEIIAEALIIIWILFDVDYHGYRQLGGNETNLALCFREGGHRLIRNRLLPDEVYYYFLSQPYNSFIAFKHLGKVQCVTCTFIMHVGTSLNPILSSPIYTFNYLCNSPSCSGYPSTGTFQNDMQTPPNVQNATNLVFKSLKTPITIYAAVSKRPPFSE
jgi:hypothetical protein